MKIKIYELIEGAKKAEGLVVIIDVFRAFSLEAYIFAQGVEKIYPVATVEEAFALKQFNSEYILIGERGGAMVNGFDFGNSPSSFLNRKLYGKTAIHTTSAGTQGISNAKKADEIIVASFTNAYATAKYIKDRNPETVSLVCMGKDGVRSSKEDILCAEYIKSLLEDKTYSDIDEKLLDLKNTDGKKFFDKDRQDVFPEKDFWLCIRRDIFPFVIKTTNENERFVNRIIIINEVIV